MVHFSLCFPESVPIIGGSWSSLYLPTEISMTKKQKPNKTWKLGELVRLQRKEKKIMG